MVGKLVEPLELRIAAHTEWLESYGKKGHQFEVDSDEFNSIDLQGTNLSEIIAPAARFYDCNLKNTDFNGANLSSVVFDKCDLTDASFVKANLDYAVFRNCITHGTSYFRATLYSATFENTSLEAVNLNKTFTVGMKVE